MERQDDRNGRLESSGARITRDPLCSRRQTLKWGGMSIIGLSVLGPLLAQGATAPLIIMEQAEGLVVADTAKCVGCGRCELACTEFNDGKAAPSLSRIKVDRNLNFGPAGLLAWREGQGNWGNGLVVQDLCKQCPHPVPCANICPEDAIVVAPVGKARMVDLEKCTGCGVCLKACPWEMISFDPDTQKATKCHLCSGKPKCVEACPAGSLSYVYWRDLTDTVPPRIATAAVLAPERAIACQSCHLPGQKASVREGFRLLLGTVKGARPSSAREFGARWIDLVGAIVLPVAVTFVVVHGALRKGMKK
ncbi:MAG TPA: 4Fe-4S dicluster domain-containing protein [Syntrophales bacterium]